MRESAHYNLASHMKKKEAEEMKMLYTDDFLHVRPVM